MTYARHLVVDTYRAMYRGDMMTLDEVVTGIMQDGVRGRQTVTKRGVAQYLARSCRVVRRGGRKLFEM